MFAGGATESIILYDDATAELRGGQINYITIYRRPQDSSEVTIYCQDGWQWLYTSGSISGITGLWKDGTSFEIRFDNVGAPYPPTANFVHVIPEPAALVLLALGGLMIGPKK